MIIFETERLVVRQFAESDMDNFFCLSGNEEVMRYIRKTSTKDESDIFLMENIAGYEKFPHRGRWAVQEKQTGNFAGSFAIIPLPWNTEQIQLGYSLKPENWGKGYATELTREGLSYFFATDRLNEIYGVTESPNTVSQKVLLKSGFRPFGKRNEEEKELLIFIAERKSEFT